MRPGLRDLASLYGTDKSANAHYLANFERAFEPLREREIVLLELGVLNGDSLKLWRDYFPRARVLGLDLNDVAVADESGRIKTFEGRQDDVQLLTRIRRDEAPLGFDIVIDDCSHLGEPSRTSFWHLFREHLRPGGIYCIEDWGTGYWSAWPDGRSLAAGPSRPLRRTLYRAIAGLEAKKWIHRHQLLRRLVRRMQRAAMPTRFPSHDYGMVGFVKELVDECGSADATKAGWGTGNHRPSEFSELRISEGHVFVFKPLLDGT